MPGNKPILYYTPRSPPCRSVLLTAAALGLELELNLLNMKEGAHLTPEYIKMNPTHTVPVLNDNGVIISDSHVICGYLVDTYGKDDSLYPKDPAQRRVIDARMHYDSGNLFSRARFIVEPVIYLGASAIPEDRIEYMIKAYDGVERCLANSDYLAGDKLTIADLCTVATLSSSERFAPIEAKKFPKLSAWMQRMSQLPYYAKVNVEGVDMLEKLVRDIIAERQKASA